MIDQARRTVSLDLCAARFAEVEKYKARHKADLRKSRHSIYRPADFLYDPVQRTCICPAGKPMYQNGQHCHLKGREPHTAA